jgi:hypothetical protein
LISLALDIARRLETAGIDVQSLGPRLFGGPAGSPALVEIQDVGGRDRKLSFDF